MKFLLLVFLSLTVVACASYQDRSPSSTEDSSPQHREVYPYGAMR